MIAGNGLGVGARTDTALHERFAVGARINASRPMLGGRVTVRIKPDPVRGLAIGPDAPSLLDRIEAWARHLTRFDDASDLSVLNHATLDAVSVGPTLAGVLDWGREAEGLTDGLVNIAMLDERIAAEHRSEAEPGSGGGPRPSGFAARSWSLTRRSRGAVVHRWARLRFDLDGVAKGWLADRAADLLDAARHRVVVVDADGDIAIRLREGDHVAIGIEDPGRPSDDLAVLRLGEARAEGPITVGVATSGVTRHAWHHGAESSHHLIDPRTGHPARTDLLQATVVAGTARAAEAFAKAAVVLGSASAAALLARPAVLGAVLLTDDRRILITPGTERLLA